MRLCVTVLRRHHSHITYHVTNSHVHWLSQMAVHASAILWHGRLTNHCMDLVRSNSLLSTTRRPSLSQKTASTTINTSPLSPIGLARGIDQSFETVLPDLMRCTRDTMLYDLFLPRLSMINMIANNFHHLWQTLAALLQNDSTY